MADDVARVLDLLQRAGESWRTLRATGRVWRDDDRPGQAGVGVGGGAGFPDEPWRVWVSHPDRSRAEFGRSDAPLTVVCAAGRLWRSPVPTGIASSIPRPGPPELGPAAALVEVGNLADALVLDVRGRSTFIGREVLVVHARPRPSDADAASLPDALASGADEYLLMVDTERGVLLRNEARLDGDPFLVVEATEIAFDDALPSSLFAIGDGDGDGEPEPVGPEPDDQAGDGDHDGDGDGDGDGPVLVDQGPPHDVLGAPIPLQVVVVNTADLVVALTEIVAYPSGATLTLTVRSPALALLDVDSEAITLEIGFSDGRVASTASVDPSLSAPALVALVDRRDRPGQTDLRYWLTPIPPRGRLTAALAWKARGISPTRVVVDSGPIAEVARRSRPLW